MAEKQERTEEPSPRKLSESREEGQVPRSSEVPIAMGLFALVFTLWFIAQGIVLTFQRAILHYFGTVGQWVGEDLTIMRISDIMSHAVRFIWVVMGPMFLALVVMGIFSNIIQVGPFFSFKPLTPKLERIGFSRGLGALFSQRSVAEAIKNFLKVICVGFLAYRLLRAEMPIIMMLAHAGPEPVLKVMAWLAFRLALHVAILFMILALIDWPYQRWRHRQNLRMSREEVKEETKQYEGDPHTKSRIRTIQRDLARRRMMRDVPTASVVITNPFEIAIAIAYDRADASAPVVVAKGARLIAARIRETARDAHVPIVEDRTLARALYRDIPVGSEISNEYYKAVAEILAYIFRLGRSTASLHSRLRMDTSTSMPTSAVAGGERA